ncbi:Hsp33 family molecular chaperone HslO [Candidatus Promineifilum breve]|nr:Hsp33 family molecular chaperone HslO [Candidatus Promineifilum breve]
MKDYMYLAMAKKDGGRGYAASTTGLVEEARLRHNTSPTATVALGRALTAAALMSGLLKVGQRVALKWEGSGPLRKIIVEADSKGRVRGYVAEPGVDLSLLHDEHDVAGAIGSAGLLTVVRDLHLADLAEGVVHLVTSDIQGDLTYFLEQSDQVPSAVEIGVSLNEDGSVAAAGGILIQPLPPYEPTIVERLKERLQEMPPVTAMLADGRKPEEILDEVFADVPHTLLSKYPVRFECNCSREQTAGVLVSLGREELEGILASEGQVSVDCHFCHEEYVFDRADVEAILAAL